MKPLLLALSPLYPAFAISDEALWDAAVADRVYDNARLRVLRTYLKDLLEDFIVATELEANKPRRDMLLLEGLLKRDCHEAARREIRDAKQDLSNAIVRLEEMEFALELVEKQLELDSRLNQVVPGYPWEAIIQQIEDLATVKRLRLLTGWVGTRGFQAIDSAGISSELDWALEAIPEQARERQPLIAMYFHLLSLLSGRGVETNYLQLKAMLAEYSPVMDPTEKVNVYGLMVNYFQEQYRQKVPGSMEIVFQIFQEMHREGLIFGLGAVTEVAIKSILLYGTRLGENAWVRTFLEEVQAKLPPVDADQMWHYGSAMLDFTEQKFASAKRHLTHLELSTAGTRVFHDSLLMRICYETNDQDGLEVITAVLLRHLYRKEKIAESTKRAAIHLAKAVIVLFDLRWSDSSKMNLAEVRAYIDKLQPISHLDWIEAKLTELEPGGQSQPARDHGPAED